jgi:hypothetical protein
MTWRISAMNQTLCRRIAVAVVVFAFPIAASADLSESTLLPTNSALNLDTDAVVSSGGDVLWNGSTIAPQGTAKIRNLGAIGTVNFNGLPQSYWVEIAPGAKATPIPATQVVAGDVFVAITNTRKDCESDDHSERRNTFCSIHHLRNISGGRDSNWPAVFHLASRTTGSHPAVSS